MKISFWMGVMLMLASCGGRQEDADVEQEYELMTVATSDYKLSTEYVASLKGRQDIRIIPRVEGYLQGICVTEGEHVKEGQVLFMLDDASYRAALQSAQANVQQMTALLAKTQLDYAGKQKLYEQKFISDHELASAKSDLDVAKANLAAAKASLASAGNDLSYTVLRSPSDGVIGRIPYRKGDYVGPNIQDGLTVVADNACMRAYFSMSENALMNYLAEYKTKEAALQQMPDLKLRLSNGRLYDKTGRAESISGIVDESTGAVQVCAVFDNSDGILLSGGTARVVMPGVRKNVIVIPQEAAFEILNKTYVYRVVDGTAKSCVVTTEAVDNGKQYVVTNGLKSGDIIIAKGAGLVQEGTKVRQKK